MTNSPLFDTLIEVSGLSKIFAKNTLRRALQRANVDPDALTPSALQTALPEIRKSIEPFLEAKTDAAMQKIERLTRG